MQRLAEEEAEYKADGRVSFPAVGETTPVEIVHIIEDPEKKMKPAAAELELERAGAIRARIAGLHKSLRET